MHTRLFATAGILSLACTLGSSAAQPRVEWIRRLDRGLEIAAQQQKDLFVNFTSHGGCYYCELLDKLVLSRPEFAVATRDFVLVELDYPSAADHPDGDLKSLYERWSTDYLIRGYPTVVLADSRGTPYAYVEYPDELTVQNFLEVLKACGEARQARDRLFAEADRVEGLARAEKLHAALQIASPLLGKSDALRDDALLVFCAGQVEEICRLDGQNAAQIRGVYDARRNARDLARAKRQRRESLLSQLELFEDKKKWPEAIDSVERLLPTVSDAESIWQLERARQTFLEWGGQYEGALDNVRRLLADPARASEQRDYLLQRESYNLFKSGRFDEGLAKINQQILEAADRPEKRLSALSWKCHLLIAHGTPVQAIMAWRDYRAALQHGSEEWREATAMLAWCLDRGQQYQEAIAVRGEVLDDDPHRYFLLLKNAESQQALGLIQQARDSLDRAENDPTLGILRQERHADRELLQQFRNDVAQLRKLLEMAE